MNNFKLAGQFFVATVVAGCVAAVIGHWLPPTSWHGVWAIVTALFGILLFATVCTSIAAIIEHIGQWKTMTVKGRLLFVFAPVILIFLLLVVLALPSFFKACATSQRNACHNNLIMIRSGIDATAMVYRWKDGDPVQPELVAQYLKGSTLPVCPSGGSYSIPLAGKNPTCSVHGDLLNNEQDNWIGWRTNTVTRAMTNHVSMQVY
jgi:MFS family permease